MENISEIIGMFEPIFLIPIACFLGVAILAQWSLYDKCGQPGLDCVIPIKNVITFLKIVGRPANHSLMVMIPPPLIILVLMIVSDPTIQYALASALFIPWAYFMIKVYIELCQCFGHYKLSDYFLVVLFNGFYVLHLGLSYSEKYRGPVYRSSTKEVEKNMGGSVAA